MTHEQKHKISMDLEGFVGDLPDSILDLLRAQTSDRGDGGEEEIEIDIDDLSDETLFTIRKILDDHLQSQENQKNLAKSEAYEIELPNVPGLSNSSLQVDKGNDAIDEDVDVGGNEASVTSYPPILIDKDTETRAEEYNEAGPDSDRGSECSKGSSAVKRVQDDICQATDSAIKRDTDELIGGHCKYSDEKADPERARREREELEMQKRREKARLQAEAKAEEDARNRAEAEAAAEERRRRELEREEAREALLKMEKTVEMNETSHFLEDLEMLRGAAAAPLDQLIGGSNCVDERSPEQTHDGFGSFRFEGSNPLE